jgi:hypothetical protein
MIGLIGIFVITSSTCSTIYRDCNHKIRTADELIVKIRVSTSSDVSAGETVRPVCEWIDHKWIEILRKVDNGIVTYLDFKCEIQQCIYCDKKRIKKEVWEDVK